MTLCADTCCPNPCLPCLRRLRAHCCPPAPPPPPLLLLPLSSAASLWMLTTYLDDNLRISRDDEGRVFVMLKVRSGSGRGMWCFASQRAGGRV